MSHAKLSASSSNRWLHCTASVKSESIYPDVTSEFAQEGTNAHEMAQLILTEYLWHSKSEIPTWMNIKEYKDSIVETIKSYGDIDLQDMLRHVMIYVNTCEDLYNAMSQQYDDTHAFVEFRLDYSDYVPSGYGTGDFVILGGNQIVVIDLKYGMGVNVDIVNNSQLKLYALGAYQTYSCLYQFDKVKTIIVQPRITIKPKIAEYTTDELKQWGEKIKPIAKNAYNGTNVEYHQGPWCKFCKCNGRCKAQSEQLFSRFIKTINNIKEKNYGSNC